MIATAAGDGMQAMAEQLVMVAGAVYGSPNQQFWLVRCLENGKPEFYEVRIKRINDPDEPLTIDEILMAAG